VTTLRALVISALAVWTTSASAEVCSSWDWEIEEIPSTTSSSGALAVDSSGVVRVLFDGTDGRPLLATREVSGTWEIADVGAPRCRLPTGRRAFAIDHGGTMHAVCIATDGDHASLLYLSGGQGAWNREVVASRPIHCQGNPDRYGCGSGDRYEVQASEATLTLDAAGGVHVAYAVDITDVWAGEHHWYYQLHHAERRGPGSWQRTRIAEGQRGPSGAWGPFPGTPALCAQGDGTLRMAFLGSGWVRDHRYLSLNLATRSLVGDWSWLEVYGGDLNYAGPSSACAVDSEDRLHLATLYDNALRDLAYGIYHPEEPIFDWHPELFDTDADAWVGADNSLGIDRQGRVHLTYIGEGGLKHAVKANGAWTIQLVEPGEIRALSPLVLGGNDALHVSYVDPDGKLKHARARCAR
jgi:hypothetical protein